MKRLRPIAAVAAIAGAAIAVLLTWEISAIAQKTDAKPTTNQFNETPVTSGAVDPLSRMSVMVKNQPEPTNQVPTPASPGSPPLNNAPSTYWRSEEFQPKKSKEPQELKVISVSYGDASFLAASLQQVFKSATIVPDQFSNSIVIRGDADELKAIEALALKLDQAAEVKAKRQAEAMAKLREQPAQTPDALAGLVQRPICAPSTGGVVKVVAVKQGDAVKRGQLLVEIWPHDLVDKGFKFLGEDELPNKEELMKSFGHNRDHFAVRSPVDGIVASPKQLREMLINRQVSPDEQLMFIAVTPVEPKAFGDRSSQGPTNPIAKTITQKHLSEADKRANEIAAEYRAMQQQHSLDTTGLPQPPGGFRRLPANQKLDELQKALKAEVTEAFDERQQSQTAELDQLRQRLNQIETTIKNREKNRETIINRRVEELINPDVKWDAGAAMPQSNSAASRASKATDSVEAPSQSQSAKREPNDSEAIQGSWVPEATFIGGKSDDFFLDLVFTREVVAINNDENERSKLLYKLDPSKSPKWIDFSTPGGELYKGIYQIDGDTLKIGFPSDKDQERPTAFEPASNLAKYQLWILRRGRPTQSRSSVRISAPVQDPFVAVPPPVATPQPDQQALLGDWKVISAHDGGKRSREDMTELLVSKEELTFVKKSGGPERFSYKLDPTQSPKWIDFWEGNRQVFKGIYELNGDELKICTSEGSRKDERPAAFESEPDSPNDILIILKRANNPH